MLLLRDTKARKALGMFYTVVLRDRGQDVWILEKPMLGQLAEHQRRVASINSGEGARRMIDYNLFQRNQRSISRNLRETDPGEIVRRFDERVVAPKQIGQVLTWLGYSADEVDGLCGCGLVE